MNNRLPTAGNINDKQARKKSGEHPLGLHYLTEVMIALLRAQLVITVHTHYRRGAYRDSGGIGVMSSRRLRRYLQYSSIQVICRGGGGRGVSGRHGPGLGPQAWPGTPARRGVPPHHPALFSSRRPNAASSSSVNLPRSHRLAVASDRKGVKTASPPPG